MSEPLRKDTVKIPEPLLAGLDPIMRFIVEAITHHTTQNNQLDYGIKKLNLWTDAIEKEMVIIRERHKEEDRATVLYRRRLKLGLKVGSVLVTIATAILATIFEKMWK